MATIGKAFFEGHYSAPSIAARSLRIYAAAGTVPARALERLEPLLER
jgi:hypothetical protein